jgi:hypothetical protein
VNGVPEWGIITKEFLTISLKTIHWLQRTCEWGITTKEFLTISLNTIHWSEVLFRSYASFTTPLKPVNGVQ